MITDVNVTPYGNNEFNPTIALKSRNRALITDTASITVEANLIRMRNIIKRPITTQPLEVDIVKLHRVRTEAASRTVYLKNSGVRRTNLVMIKTFTSIRKNLMKLITIVKASLSGHRKSIKLQSESNALLSLGKNAHLSHA